MARNRTPFSCITGMDTNRGHSLFNIENFTIQTLFINYFKIITDIKQLTNFPMKITNKFIEYLALELFHLQKKLLMEYRHDRPLSN
jgi:hypothetical protein